MAAAMQRGAAMLLLCAGPAVLVTTGCVALGSVSGRSMHPTLNPDGDTSHDIVLMVRSNRLAPHAHDPVQAAQAASERDGVVRCVLGLGTTSVPISTPISSSSSSKFKSSKSSLMSTSTSLSMASSPPISWTTSSQQHITIPYLTTKQTSSLESRETTSTTILSRISRWVNLLRLRSEPVSASMTATHNSNNNVSNNNDYDNDDDYVMVGKSRRRVRVVIPTRSNDRTSRRSSSVGNTFTISAGDIVMLTSPSNPDLLLMKRVLAVGGELVRPRVLPSEGTSPRLRDLHRHLGVSSTTLVAIPPNHVWVESDDPFHGIDSNHFGPVSAGLITGKVIAVLWPPNRFLTDISHAPNAPHSSLEAQQLVIQR